MSFYDGLDYDVPGLVVHIDKPKMDDPCTIEFNSLDELPLAERSGKQNGKFVYPANGCKVNELVIPFRNVGMMTVKLLWKNELYGYLREDQPVRYDVSRALWHRCPSGYHLCYTRTQCSVYEMRQGVRPLARYQGYDSMGQLSDDGQRVVKLFTDPNVSADQVLKALNSLDVRFEGKLRRVYGEGWLQDQDWLDLDSLLASNGLVQ